MSGGSVVRAKEHMIVLGSLSKTYAMTGRRAGFALGPGPIIAAMSKLQSQSTASIVQKASIAALKSWQECVAEIRASDWRGPPTDLAVRFDNQILAIDLGSADRWGGLVGCIGEVAAVQLLKHELT